MDYISTHYNTDTLKERIKELRKLRGNQYKQHQTENKSQYKKFECCQSQELLAEEIGVKRQTLIDWESPKKPNRLPSLTNLIQLCQIFDCSMDYLLGTGDHPEIDLIAKASYYSKISPEIIRYGIENQDYLDCLNFFMLPENCSTLFNNVTLSAWKKYWVDATLSEIKSPLKENLYRFFDEYNAITPFEKINKSTYKSFLESKLPKTKLIITSEKMANGFHIKKSFSPIVYQNFYTYKEFNYSAFIEYLVDYTFEPLSYNSMIELQKVKLSNAFTNLFTKYLEEL